MGRVKDIVMDIEAMLELGHSFETIARQLDIPVRWVVDAARAIEEADSQNDDFEYYGA